MNTVLVISVLVWRLWTPQYVVVYATEQQCEAAATAFNQKARSANVAAVCVPKIETPK